MKLYIAGPITGYPDDNRQAFLDAARHLRSQGHEVCCPVELDDGACEAWEDYLARDLKHLVDCEGVCVLPAWRFSRGAVFEVSVAVILKIPIYLLSPPRLLEVSIPKALGMLVRRFAKGPLGNLFSETSTHRDHYGSTQRKGTD